MGTFAGALTSLKVGGTLSIPADARDVEGYVKSYGRVAIKSFKIQKQEDGSWNVERVEWHAPVLDFETEAKASVAIDDPVRVPKEKKVKKSRAVKWTKEQTIEASRGFTARADFMKRGRRWVCYARKHGWLEECLAQWPVVRHSGTHEQSVQMCLKIARQCSTRTELNTKFHSVYMLAYNHNVLDWCCEHMGRRGDRKHPWDDMKVGDSFTGTGYMHQAAGARMRKCPGTHFRVRKQPDGSYVVTRTS